jgi:hypothetical protein
VRLVRTIHVAWITTLRRNRREVIHAFLERRCQEPDVARSRVVNHCVNTEGERLDPLVYERECDSGKVTEPREMP